MKKGLYIALALVVGVGIGALGASNLQGTLKIDTYPSDSGLEGSVVYGMPRVGEVFIGNPDTKVPWFDVFIEDNENVMIKDEDNVMIKDEDNVMIDGFPRTLSDSMVIPVEEIFITGFPTSLADRGEELGLVGKGDLEKYGFGTFRIDAVDAALSEMVELAFVPQDRFEAEEGVQIVLFDELNPESLSKVHIVLFDESGKEALASSYNGDFELDYDARSSRLSVRSDRFRSGKYLMEIVGLQLGKSDVAHVMHIPVEFK